MKTLSKIKDEKIIKRATINTDIINDQILQYDKIIKFVNKEFEESILYDSFDTKLLNYMENCAREAKNLMKKIHNSLKFDIENYATSKTKNDDFKFLATDSSLCVQLNETTLAKIRLLKIIYARRTGIDDINKEAIERKILPIIKEESKIQLMFGNDSFEERQKTMIAQLFDSKARHVTPFMIFAREREK